jgi:hypothetical protein
MSNDTSQVQKHFTLPPDFKRLSKLDKQRWRDRELADFLLADWGKIRSRPFGPAPHSKRSYPGEREAQSVVRYLESAAAASKQGDIFRKLLRFLQRSEETLAKQRKQGSSFVDRFRTVLGAAEVLAKLGKFLSGRKRAVEIVHNGIVFQPTTLQGIVALAVVYLFYQKGLHRFRQCLHCGAWFYARFRHQQFCIDEAKKCQWNHYHSPAWRKKHRETNRQHQRAFRDRRFGKRSR